jgi:hypothetical protein
MAHPKAQDETAGKALVEVRTEADDVACSWAQIFKMPEKMRSDAVDASASSIAEK